MNELLDMIYKDFLWVDYGNVEGMKDKEDISLRQLFMLKMLTEVAIMEKQREEIGS